MKHKTLWASLALLALFGCKPDAQPEQKPDDKPDDKPVVEQLTAPVLSADVTTVEVDAESDAQALKLTWTSAGEDATYKLEVGTATPSVLTVTGLEKVLTHKELASFGEAPYSVAFKIKASAPEKDDVWSNPVTVQVNKKAPARVFPEHLYIYFWGFENPANAKEMEKVSDGVWTWTADVTQWEFKFMTELGEYWSGYFRDEKADDYWTLREGGEQCMFQLNDVGMPAGNYTFTVDLNTMKVTVKKNEIVKPLPEELYIYFWEWENAVNAKKMTALGDGKFTWDGACPRWNMKFTTANSTGDDYWGGYFRDPDAGDYWTLKRDGTEVLFDLNRVGRDGWYTINVDLNTLHVEAIPHIWLIGSAFACEWDRSKAEEMTYLGDHQFTWTGQITNTADGIFKFLVRVDEGSDWYGYWRNDTDGNYWKAGEDYNNDAQFSVTAEGGISSPGRCTITLNTETGAVTLAPAVE